MSAHIGVSNLHGVSAPTGCVINESDFESNQPIKTYLNAAGNAFPDQLKMTTSKIVLKGTGIPPFSLISAASTQVTGTAYIVMLDIEESSDARPTFTLTAVQYS